MKNSQLAAIGAVLLLAAGAVYYVTSGVGQAPATSPTPAPAAATAPAAGVAPAAPVDAPADPACTQYSLVAGAWVCTSTAGN